MSLVEDNIKAFDTIIELREQIAELHKVGLSHEGTIARLRAEVAAWKDVAETRGQNYNEIKQKLAESERDAERSVQMARDANNAWAKADKDRDRWKSLAEELGEALEFYADRESWNIAEPKGRAGFIHSSDFDEVLLGGFGGKRARAALAKLKEESR